MLCLLSIWLLFDLIWILLHIIVTCEAGAAWGRRIEAVSEPVTEEIVGR